MQAGEAVGYVVLHANADSHATALEVGHLQQKQERQFWLGAEIDLVFFF